MNDINVNNGKEYIGISKVTGPLLFIEDIKGVGFDEVVEIRTRNNEIRHGRVLSVSRNSALIEVFEGTGGLAISSTRVRFQGRPMQIPVSMDMLGRVFNGMGMPIDSYPKPISRDYRDINGLPINPIVREYPSDFIQTGISAIDCMNTLVQGQKLPIFSGSGLPHNQLAAQIVRQARVLGQNERFAIVFAAMGIKNVLPSLSRLMNDGIGDGKTREDHANISNQLYAAYSYVRKVETLASIIGENELSDKDKKYLEFGKSFEDSFVKQGSHEERSIKESLELAWDIVSILPREELIRVTEKQIEKYYLIKKEEADTVCRKD
ncbi:MAG: hypothetical protein JSU78_02650 [Deltaproteobacteria bacterium]|nr:MAG: hypothetical protein JSU78_02650 [Deltaproteobacteria bacterium]